MPSPITNLADQQPAATATAELFETWFDPIETAVRDRVHGFIQAMIEAELDEALSRTRYVRGAKACPGPKSETPDDESAGAGPLRGHRHGHRSRSLMGTFGEVEISVPRARIEAADGKTREWKSNVLPAYQRRTNAADALIAGAYLAGTNTRRVRRALAALFGGAVSKDTVSRVWRKVKTDWEGWNARSLADEPIVRLILDGTVVRVRLDKKATTICLLVVLGIRADGQKVLLAVKRGGRRPAVQLHQIAGQPMEKRAQTNAIERLHEEFKRRIKTQTVLPSAETAAMMFWALVASGQISMRKVDGWKTLAVKPADLPIDLAA